MMLIAKQINSVIVALLGSMNWSELKASLLSDITRVLRLFWLCLMPIRGRYFFVDTDGDIKMSGMGVVWSTTQYSFQFFYLLFFVVFIISLELMKVHEIFWRENLSKMTQWTNLNGRTPSSRFNITCPHLFSGKH